MARKLLVIVVLAMLALVAQVGTAAALSRDRYANQQPYGFFFNDYGPNFYVGFVPREQDRTRITIHLGRGNQIRLRLVLSEPTIDGYVSDQVARHDLYKELIDKQVITLTTNKAWEAYEQRFATEGLADLAKKKASMSAPEWRELSLRTLAKLMPERVYHIEKDVNRMLDEWKTRLASGDPTASLEAKLDAVNDLFPHRMDVTELSASEDAALAELVQLARGGDAAAFRAKAAAFFSEVTGGIYPIANGKLDYWEVTAIYAAGTHDSLTTHDGHQIPEITTQGVWKFIPRDHGKGFTGMVDYISSEGYYGLKPMLPYEYAGGITYNAIHNTGISNWIQGHPLLPKDWNKMTDGSRDGKLDYWEITAIYAAGTYDQTTTYKNQVIPDITTPGVWPLIPRMHGKGFTGMIDYISSEGYYGLMPMLPYEYAGGITYNAIHNTGISNWIAGHPILPTQWKSVTTGSRNGKPFNRVALTSRGPVSHGCTRLNNGHLTELREMLPSTSEGMLGIVQYRNPSQCYDVFDPKGDGDDQVMGVQYYIAFRHTNARVMKQIWVQNNREDFYRWMYGDDMNFGPIGSVTLKDVCDGEFVAKKARVGKTYKELKLYEAPNAKELIQFYVVKGRSAKSMEVMDFNRELRRVGYGYTIDRKKLFLD